MKAEAQAILGYEIDQRRDKLALRMTEYDKAIEAVGGDDLLEQVFAARRRQIGDRQLRRLWQERGRGGVADEPVQRVEAGGDAPVVELAAEIALGDEEQDHDDRARQQDGEARAGDSDRAGDDRGHDQQRREHRIGQVQAGGAVADEVGIGEVLQVLPRGQALHCRIQFLRSGLEQGPEQEQDEAQKAGTNYRQQVDGEADGDVGQQSGRFAQSMPEQPPEEREKTGNCRNEKENFVVHWIGPRLKANWRVKPNIITTICKKSDTDEESRPLPVIVVDALAIS